MKKIGLLKAINLCSKYQKLGAEEKQILQRKRLEEIVKYAKENSEYYKKLYKDLPENFELKDLKPVNKLELMKNYNEWLTTKDISLSELNEFMKDMDNIGRKYKGEYLIFTTSGSTGNPLVAVCDKSTNNVMTAINIGRTYARKQDLSNFIKSGGKTIGIFANGFYLGAASVRARLLSMPWKKRQMAVSSALLPVDDIVKQLNEFQPSMLGGYPSNLELLIDEQKSGRLHIKPVIIMTGGEYLSPVLREKLGEAFNCYVQTSYSCTEGGTVACECTEHHFHVNDDWLIVEAVDKNNNPVPDGVQSDKILLTNMFNYTQPFIRYEVTDRVVMYHDKCPCGNPSPYLTIEGRTDDVVSFVENGEVKKVPPLAIYALLKEIHKMRRFQLVVRENNYAELRIVPSDGSTKEECFEIAKKELIEFLKIHGISSINLKLSDEEPKQHQKSGKFKHIVNEIKK